jgi:hypothetical protein
MYFASLRNPGSRRRDFFKALAAGSALASVPTATRSVWGQIAGERPNNQTPEVSVINPQNRVPVGLIIDDSTCLVNLNRFAMPQFDTAFGGSNPSYKKNWRDWPVEIPDAFVRKFGEWCADQGVKGKYSIVPFPACVGRLDRMLPGWTQKELSDSIELVRQVMLPNWDIHPEMVTHTRVIDIKTGHPYPDHSVKFMENWEWTTGRSPEEIADYMRYALQILKNIGLPCEGVTTPGGFGNRALPQLAQAALAAVRDIFEAEVPHYFRHLYDRGEESVAPRVEYVSGLQSGEPRCVVSIIGCTGDWTGGWDCTPPGGADKFITPDLQSGRMVEVIQRGEPALMLAHWTGFYFNGEETGFKIFQEVVHRLQRRFDNLIWMKLSEVARYWAAKELTTIVKREGRVFFDAPIGTPRFTVRIANPSPLPPGLISAGKAAPLRPVNSKLFLQPGSWFKSGNEMLVCFDLVRGMNVLSI